MDRERVLRLVRKHRRRETEANTAWKAAVLLLMVDGMNDLEIAQGTGLSRPVLRRLYKEFDRDGLIPPEVREGVHFRDRSHEGMPPRHGSGGRFWDDDWNEITREQARFWPKHTDG